MIPVSVCTFVPLDLDLNPRMSQKVSSPDVRPALCWNIVRLWITVIRSDDVYPLWPYASIMRCEHEQFPNARHQSGPRGHPSDFLA